MASVPENQRIEKVLETRFNPTFASQAQQLLPTLHTWPCRPRRLVHFQTDNTYFGLSPKGLDLDLESQLWGKRDEFVFDFGTHLVGSLSFSVRATGVNIDAPCRLRLTFGESPYDVTEDLSTCDTWISTAWLPDEVINIDYLPAEISLPRRYSFRYLRVQIIDTSPKYKVSFTDVVCSAMSAVNPESSIELSDYGDPLLQAMDEVSIITLRDCMQTVFEDGPRRDRRLWIGDLRLQALTNYCTLKDYNLVKRCLYLFAALPREDDSLPACLFEKPKLTPATDYIVDYDALFGTIVYDYVVASGDLGTGHALWPTVQGSLKGALAHLDPSTSVFDSSRVRSWKFLDWASDLDTSAGLHGLLLYTLKNILALASLLGLQAPQDYVEIVEKMTAAAESFYDTDQKLFVCGPNKQVSLASAAWLTLSGAFPDTLAREALLNALNLCQAEPVSSSSASPPTHSVVKPLTPYLWHHVCDALVAVHAYDECLTLMKSYWGGMIRAGADTFWEVYDAKNPRFSPYGSVLNNSFCHAWSCTPAWLLRIRLAKWGGWGKKEGEERATMKVAELQEKMIEERMAR